MPAEAVVIPLWGKLVLFSLGKKAAVVWAGYIYGFPRLFRRCQKLVRRSAPESSRQQLHGFVRTAFRLPARLLHLQPRRQPASPALQYLARLPARLPAGQHRLPAHRPAAPNFRPLQRLRPSFASSGLAQRQAQHLAAGRAKLASLRESFAGSGALQSMVASRAQRAAEMWGKIKQQPYSFVQAVQ